MFAHMLDGVKEEAVGAIFRFQPPRPEQDDASGPPVRLRGQHPGAQRRQQQLLYTAPVIDGAAGQGEGQVTTAQAPALGITGPPTPSRPTVPARW